MIVPICTCTMLASFPGGLGMRKACAVRWTPEQSHHKCIIILHKQSINVFDKGVGMGGGGGGGGGARGLHYYWGGLAPPLLHCIYIGTQIIAILCATYSLYSNRLQMKRLSSFESPIQRWRRERIQRRVFH